MADATSTVTVDGVKPSILVKLLNIPDNPAAVKIFDDDTGGERWLVKENEEPVLVTPTDLGVLGVCGIEIVDPSAPTPAETADKDVKDNAPIPTQNAPEGVVKLSPGIPTGQSSPQV